MTTAEVIGDARVSTEDQNLDLQRDALGRAGCSRIYEDRASGARGDWPGLALAVDVARAGDKRVVWHLDRLGRSMSGVKRVLARVHCANECSPLPRATACVFRRIPAGDSDASQPVIPIEASR